MCVSIEYLGRHIDNFEDARKLLGLIHVFVLEGHPLDAMEGKVCLCPLDIEKTAESLRLKYKRSDLDPMLYEFFSD